MIKFDAEGNIQDYTLILSKRNHQHMGQLRNVTDMVSKPNFNAANEISFTVYKYNEIENIENDDSPENIEPLWDEITDFKFVYVKELDEYYEIIVEMNEDEKSIYKTVTGTSACECELSQAIIYGLEINTESDILRDDYKEPSKFYNPDNPDASILHRALYKVPQYTIKHVDASLVDIQRMFSADGEDTYSFLTSTIAEEIGCLFTFDTVDRSISVYDLKTVCLDCGHRDEFSDVCPECGSTNIKYYGEDTTIYVDTENLAEGVTFVTDTDSVKNCFRLEAGDDNMTAAVTNLNPNGSGYIYYFSEETKHDMSVDLVDKMESYDKLQDSYREEYQTVMNNMYDAIDKIIYYTSEMMPKRENEPTDAKKEAAKLTVANLSPTGLTAVTTSTSTATVNTALKNYAKIYINSGKFKIEINQGEFNYEGVDTEGYNYGYWYGNFKITNYADEEDTAISELITVKIYDSYQEFLEQKIEKKLAENRDEEGNVFDVLSIKELEPFKEALKLYCLNRLTSFNDAIQGVIDIMIEADQAKEGASFYDEFYVPYYNKLEACQAEIDVRSATIDQWENTLDTAQKRQMEIQNILNFEAYLGEELYKEFCSHRREDKYSNENYVSDGLSNKEMFERAEEFIKEAEKQLIRAGEYQHTISSTLANLLVMEEFQPLKDKFALGNFIRIRADGKVYRLRLIGYQINFSDPNNIEVEFSDVTKIKDGTSDLNSILDQASSMASSYDSIVHQVEKNKESDELVKNWIENGMDLTNMKIVSSADNQTYVWDKHGLLLRSFDDTTETYLPEQMRLVNSTIAITDDNWKTIKTAVGRYYYQDPTTGEDKVAYGISGEVLVGKLILGESLGIYSDDAYASMTFDNKGLVLNAKRGADNRYDRIIDIQIDGKSCFYISRDGDLVIDNGQLGTIEGDLSSKVDKEGVILAINQSTESIRIKAGKITLEGIVTANNNFKILTDGSMEAVNGKFSGTITAKSGTIGGWQISNPCILSPYLNGTADLGRVGLAPGVNPNNINELKQADGLAIWAGATWNGSTNSVDYANAPFRVLANGNLYAKNATITGTITGSTINGGTIDGTIVSGSQFKVERTRQLDVRAGDRDLIMNIIMDQYTPNEEEKKRLDFDLSGSISSVDMLLAERMLNGQLNKTASDYIRMYTDDNLYLKIGTDIKGSNPFSRVTELRPGYMSTNTADISSIKKINTLFFGTTDSITEGKDYVLISGNNDRYNGVVPYLNFYTNGEIYMEAGYNSSISLNKTYGVSLYSDLDIVSNKQITVSSDERLKENIVDIDLSALVDILLVKEFNYKNDSQKTVGVIAQQFIGTPFEDIILRKGKDGYYSVDYNVILMALVSYIQKQKNGGNGNES